MKSIVLLFLLITSIAHGQDKEFVYCEIIATQKFMNPNKTAIELDMGQERSYWKDNRLRDEVSGKIKSFNSRMDAVNYLAEQGWELANTFVSDNGNQYTYHYIMRRKAE